MSRRTSWEVGVKPPNPTKRQRSWVLVAYPPSGSVDETGKPLRSERWSSETDDHEEALCEAKRVEQRLNAGSGILLSQTLESVVQAYVAGNKLSDSYEVNCFSALKAAPGLGNTKPYELTKASLLRGRDQMRSGRLNSTVNGYMRALRAAWNWAEMREIVTVPWPKIKALPARTKKRPYEAEEVSVVLLALKDSPSGFVDWYAYFCLLADTGVRPGELVRLKGEQVDRENCRLLISRNKTGSQGQERTEEWVRVPQATMDLLPKGSKGQWLWPSRGVQARGHVTVNGARLALRRALEASELLATENLDQYSFRRWWIDAADETDVSLGEAMKQTGHKKAETHLGYRRNSRRAVSQATIEKVHRHRLAPQPAPQNHVEQEDQEEVSPVVGGTYAASSLCSR